jgi:hypothetical protein
VCVCVCVCARVVIICAIISDRSYCKIMIVLEVFVCLEFTLNSAHVSGYTDLQMETEKVHRSPS